MIAGPVVAAALTIRANNYSQSQSYRVCMWSHKIYLQLVGRTEDWSYTRNISHISCDSVIVRSRVLHLEWFKCPYGCVSFRCRAVVDEFCLRVSCIVQYTLNTWLGEKISLFAISLMSYIWAATWQNQQNGCASSEDSDQPGHPPSLTRVFVVRMKKPWVLSYSLSTLRRLWSDWADAQAGLSLR